MHTSNVASLHSSLPNKKPLERPTSIAPCDGTAFDTSTDALSSLLLTEAAVQLAQSGYHEMIEWRRSPAERVILVGALLRLSTFAGYVSRDNPHNRSQIPLIKPGVLQRLVSFKPIAKAFTKASSATRSSPSLPE